MKNRNREIDFLRGIAILLVVFFHQRDFFELPLLPFLNEGFASNVDPFNMLTKNGWFGVDLFFVLSGFLVSGLLFKEYQKYNSIQAGNFLIRRGFKIYPLFYLMIGLSLILYSQIGKDFKPLQKIGELFFVRNYIGGMWGHTWSLCVEEHFYFFLCLLLYIFSKRGIIGNVEKMNRYLLIIMSISVLLRGMNVMVEMFHSRSVLFNYWVRHIQTQYRMDSLLCGVMIAYNYHFNREALQRYYSRYKKLLNIISIITFLLYIFLPSPDPDNMNWVSNLMSFAGYTLLYISFGNILLYFMLTPDIDKKMNQRFSSYLVNGVSRIGFYSYSIYLFHKLVIVFIIKEYMQSDSWVSLIVYYILSILAGVLISEVIEQFTLKMRDKYFPSRSQVLSAK
jgi:peptidoglycan/LPS O-acetylase OafA/YrhL